MRTLRTLFAKELNATLTSPIGYTVAAVFLLVLGYTFSLTLFVPKVANLPYIFHQLYVLSIGTFLMLWFADSVSYLLPPPFDSLAINLSLIGHFKPMVSGSVFLSDIGYYVTATMLALFLTAWGLEQR